MVAATSSGEEATTLQPPNPLHQNSSVHGREPGEFSDTFPANQGAEHDHLVVVKPDETLSGIFDRLSLPQSDLLAIMETGLGGTVLRRIHPGQQFRFTLDDAGSLSAIELRLRVDRTVIFEREEDRFKASEILRPIENRLTHGVGQFIHGDSLISVASDAGIQQTQTVLKAASLLGWEVDFWHDPRPGDTFQLIYDRQYVDGVYLCDGLIYAVEFVNRRKVFQSFRYESADGRVRYYTQDGESNKSAFLRAPLEYTRVSSNFSLRRFHPVLKTVRPHLGIDYAAPRGTPVRAVGDGTVAFVGRTRTNGNYLVINHGKMFQTKYLHLNSIHKSITKSSAVRQGQVIGTVGMTGLATGPHLHYEFLVNGEHRDPKTVPVERTEPIPPQQLKDFRATVNPLISMLESSRANGSGSIALHD